MPLLRLNATPAGLALHESASPALPRLAELGGTDGPAIIMVHGYKYAPGSAQHCPHRKIFGHGLDGWPAQLGFAEGTVREGLGIALGWPSRCRLALAQRRARALGLTLADIVEELRRQRPLRPVHVIAHSLGAEAAFAALPHLPAGSIDRMVLLTGACHAGRALRMLDTPAGRSVEVLNVTSRENDLFDAAYERMIRPEILGDRAIGHGIAAPNVVNLELDCPRSLEWLRAIGFDVADPERRICHWSAYRRTGVMPLYSEFLRAPETLPLSWLKTRLPGEPRPRWSRLLATPDLRRAGLRLLPLGALALGSARSAVGRGISREPKNEPAC
jgi:pimeloyl-ACP methyl ester carboxylesterase